MPSDPAILRLTNRPVAYNLLGTSFKTAASRTFKYPDMTLATEQARDRVLQQRTLAGAALAVVAVCAGLAAQRLTGVTQSGADMPSFHLLMELIAIILAVLVVVIAWHRLGPDDDTATNILICGFTIVAVCDLLHALSVAALPPLLARGDASRGIFSG